MRLALPVMRVMPPSTAAAPTMAYTCGTELSLGARRMHTGTRLGFRVSGLGFGVRSLAAAWAARGMLTKLSTVHRRGVMLQDVEWFRA